MLIPKKVKFRKWQTGRSNPKSFTPDTRGSKLSFGSYGLKSESQARKPVNIGFAFFRTDLLPPKLQKSEWEKARVTRKDIASMFFRDVLSSKWMGWTKK
uniref:50S ribosomal protein L16, large subunit ribosomal protein L16 n=1 Tax=uncultured Parcubacteria bacterium Rifle_16ft_4_minimus_31020 TaxID=1665138 RepID=A0A0H4TCI1_9BACT|nr:50S ribosomal protein L16, large subunit ribosomal protein L16 [uncultured Parcubacteria bacterium Rifle_16ft_4_minimus_31020]